MGGAHLAVGDAESKSLSAMSIAMGGVDLAMGGIDLAVGDANLAVGWCTTTKNDCLGHGTFVQIQFSVVQDFLNPSYYSSEYLLERFQMIFISESR